MRTMTRVAVWTLMMAASAAGAHHGPDVPEPVGPGGGGESPIAHPSEDREERRSRRERPEPERWEPSDPSGDLCFVPAFYVPWICDGFIARVQARS